MQRHGSLQIPWPISILLVNTNDLKENTHLPVPSGMDLRYIWKVTCLLYKEVRVDYLEKVLFKMKLKDEKGLE